MVKNSITPNQLKELVKNIVKLPNPPTLFIWGPPGVGKSYIIHEIAKELKYDIQPFILSLIDPTELKGFIMPNRNTKEAEIFPLHILPKAPGILFLDEVNTASQAVLNAAMRMIQEREVGFEKIPDNIAVICAGNRIGDKVNVSKLSSAFINKCIHLNVETSVEDFKVWATMNGVCPEVIAFISNYPGELMAEPRNDYPYPTPRAWEKVSRMMTEIDLKIDDKLPLICGLVGDEIGIKFVDFVNNTFDVPEYLTKIFNGENIYPKGTEPAKSYMLTASLSQQACTDYAKLGRVLDYFCNAPEYFAPFATSSLKTIINAIGEQDFFKYAKGNLSKFTKKYKDLFMGIEGVK